MTMPVKRTEVSKPVTDLSSIEEFLKWEAASRDTIDVKRCYIDLAGDLVTGILLSQIIYWYLPSKRGESRLRIKRRDGKHWMAKSRRDWWDECRITPKQFDRGIKILRDKGLVETRLFKFRGTPTLHVWLNGPALVEGVNLILPKGENRYLPKVKIDIGQRVKTSNIDHLTKSTNTDYFKDDGEGEDNHHPPEPDILTFFQENFKIDRVTPVMVEEIEDLVKNFSPEGVKAAIKGGGLREVINPLPYIRAVLENERDGKGKQKKPTGGGHTSSSAAAGTPDGKFAFKHAPHVFLTESEVLDLVKQFGSPGAEARIEAVSLYKGTTGKVYECDYQAILLWAHRRNPDGTPWDPEPPDWEINQEWLDSLQPKPALQPMKGGFGNNNARGPRTMTEVTCRKCGRQFNAVIPKRGAPLDVCQKCVRAEGTSEEGCWVIINGRIRRAASFDQLTSKEQRALELRFGLKDGKHPTREIANELHVCASRVRELEVNALNKLYGDRLSLKERRERFVEDYSRR